MKTSQKTIEKKHRKLQQERQQRLMRRLTWITVLCFAAIIVVAAIIKAHPSPEAFDYDKLPVLGPPDAPVKIVEFADFKCPTCQYFSQEIEPQLKKDYIDKGIVSFYFMNYTFIGPDSYTAALAGQSIFHQNKAEFWKFYDALYQNQGDETVQWATPEFLTDFAKKQGLAVDYDKLHQDIVSQTYRAEVDRDNQKAEKAKVTGTPTLFINGRKFENATDYNQLKDAINKALSSNKG